MQRWNDSFYRDTWVEVNLDHIRENVRNIKASFKQNMEIMAVVKADGYGHGAIPVAETALEAGASYLAVAILDEALQLRAAHIQAPILVLGAIRPEDIEVAASHDITITVFSAEWLVRAKSLYQGGKKIKFHMKFDTGMGRIGIRDQEEGKAVIEALHDDKRFQLEGIYTHFATADELCDDYFNMQYERFNLIVTMMEKLEVDISIIHCGNSATGLMHPNQAFNMVRLGISMYGLTPSIEIKDRLPVQLKEAFSLHAKLIQVKNVPPGEGISYGITYKTTGWEWIGTIPIGYADGWYRYHSTNGGTVLVNGENVPFVGRICMDQCMVKLPRELPVGTKVTLIGSQGERMISIDEVAGRLSTINYEVPCMVGSRIPRVYIKNHEVYTVKNKLVP
ncbi:alanine racemase [Alkalihalobacterium alkalinitrilicum]|uniref:alanine racemase n=1 Tax=Alkalihalobacterium alkalinitrilicum TaxID=427920 RepID=UPI0009953AB1|nr:alanine racemase [Alkalihalobacterium alkalinitrilicum]